MAPVIAITPCRALPDYVESVRLGGAEPLVLDYGVHPPADALSRCDGILFTGGGDIDPVVYGQTAHGSVSGIDGARDTYELALARLALEADRPMLGICRGLQVLNVAAGGTLVQDIPSAWTTPLTHVVKEPLFAIAHDVTVVPTSRLASAMRGALAAAPLLPVNSRHHQAIDRLAQGFRIVATAPDGVIEAVEHQGHRYCVAVQWHPENFWRTGEFLPLFQDFVKATAEP